jgi:phosphatidylglycerophosphatase A
VIDAKKGTFLRISEMVARGFYTGNIPLVPGTFGTAVGFAIWISVSGSFLYWALFVILWVISVPGVKAVIEESGSKDPPAVVVDEILGFLLASGLFERSVQAGLSLFVLFRIFDILKPWPASWANRGEGLLFVYLDDLVAGMYAALAHYLFVVKFLVPAWG